MVRQDRADVLEADASAGREDASERRRVGHAARLPPLQSVPEQETAQISAPNDPKKTEFGPYQFITDKVLTKLNSPELRLFGVDHIAVAWLDRDPEWTTEKGSSNNNLAGNTVPLLDRAAPTAAAEGGGGRRQRGAAP